MQKTFWILSVLAISTFSMASFAQPIGAGVVVGATLTNAVSSIGSESVPNSATVIVGPYLELRLPLGFSIEGDALYYPSLYSKTVGGGSLWQFPILAKYKFLKGPVAPFVEGGPSFSHLSAVSQLADLIHGTNYGITLGGGIEFKLLALRISPEVRYNGFAFTNLENPLGLFKSNKSQAVFLVGIGF